MRNYTHFNDEYSKDGLRGVDISQRPWSLEKKAKELGGANKRLLDIGCGTAYKTLRLANYFEHIVGMEPSPDMLQQASKNIHAKSIINMSLTRGISENLPFNSNQFDMITAILTWWKPKEVHRVLKPGGIFLLECLGPEDKTTFTKFFGKDNNGWRGANIDKDLTLLKNEIKSKLSPYFSSIEFIHDTWKTIYTKKGLWLLLCNTASTVGNFCKTSDEASFNKAFDALQNDGHVLLTQSRLVVIAKEPINK